MLFWYITKKRHAFYRVHLARRTRVAELEGGRTLIEIEMKER